MNYFVTGATGFIGRFVVKELLEREDNTVYVLVRKSSRTKFNRLKEQLDAGDNLVAVTGDVTKPGLISQSEFNRIKNNIDMVFHLAAVYDMNMDDATGDRINNGGTSHVVDFVNKLGGHVSLQHVSSIAVAGGDFEGRFTEKMFDEGQDTSHPYYRTKFQSEKIVRDNCKQPWRIYRPGMVVGHSETGEMDKMDGPYYFFPFIKAIRNHVPKWLPLLGVEGGKMPIAPVDYVARAMVEIAHQDGHDSKAFHLVQSPPDSVGKVIEILFDSAHGQGFATQFELPSLPKIVPPGVKAATNRLPLNHAMRQMSKAIGVPISGLSYLTNRAVFDDRQTRAALKDTGINCPALEDYAEVLWEYWENYMDFPPANHRLIKKTGGKIAMVTGASSGIGLDTAKKLAASGVTVVLVARNLDRLESLARVIRDKGGDAHAYSCDLNDLDAVDELTRNVLADLGRVDILINNAGRSIRRSVWESRDRFHDFERTMQLNYFSCIRLIMNLLPSMSEHKEGHIINISSIGCLANAARFSAYVASKSALDAFSRCLSAEVKSWNIDVTTIYMPLVRTPMIAPTKLYDYAPAWSVDAATDMVIKAVIERPKRMKTPLGQTAELGYALMPKFNDYLLSMGYHLFPTSSAAKGKDGEDQRPSAKGIALAQVLRGAHL